MTTNNNHELYAEVPRESAKIHQAIVLMLDSSSSMLAKAEDGRTKADIVLQCVKKLKDIELSESEKAAIDICIMSFDDEVRVLQDWIPLSDFDGEEIEYNCDGCTALSDAIIQSIDATRKRRGTYSKNGITAKRAQIFLWTDGASTQDMAPAIERCNEYLCREDPSPSCKLNVILVPPAVDPTEIMKLGKSVAIFGVQDCANGIPASFEFLEGTIVAWSQSAPGQEIVVNADEMRFIDGYGGVEKRENGGATVVDKNDIDQLWSK